MKISIYLPPEFGDQLKILPRGSVSGICQEALRDAIGKILQERDEFIADSFAED